MYKEVFDCNRYLRYSLVQVEIFGINDSHKLFVAY